MYTTDVKMKQLLFVCVNGAFECCKIISTISSTKTNQGLSPQARALTCLTCLSLSQLSLSLSLFTHVCLSFSLSPVDVKCFFTVQFCSGPLAGFLCLQFHDVMLLNPPETALQILTLKHLRSPLVDFFIFTEKHSHIMHGFKLKGTCQDVVMSHTWRCSSQARSSGWWGRPCS